MKTALTDLPEIINIEIMTVCNLRCLHCRLQNTNKTNENIMLTVEQFVEFTKKVKIFIENAHEFMFSTLEPLLHPNLFEMMDIVEKINPNIVFPIQTNGMTINENIVDELSRRNVPWISFSLDGYEQKYANDLKKGTDLNVVVKNIKLVKEKCKNIKIRTVFVATARNINTLLDYIVFCKKLGIDAVDINGLICFNQELLELTLYSEKGNEYVKEIFDKAVALANKIEIELQLPRLSPKRVGCEWHKILSINEKGDIVPCVMLSNCLKFYYGNNNSEEKLISFGNIFSDDTCDVWFSNRYINFRGKLSCGELPEDCKHCAEGYGLICSNR